MCRSPKRSLRSSRGPLTARRGNSKRELCAGRERDERGCYLTRAGHGCTVVGRIWRATDWQHRPFPIAPVEHRYAWRYLVGFVHPASGRTVFHLASTVSIPLFAVELAEFARHVGASPTKQIVLVLDRAVWHTSVKLRVPEYVHLLFLPPYSPELQPAEHLWPLTNAALINRQFATIEDLEDAQFARCAALQVQAQPGRIRSTTQFHWWPKQIHKRVGPRRR